jgi:hypothetical protein
MTRAKLLSRGPWAVLAVLLAAPAARATDDRAETAALEALDKAAADHAGKEYATATARLQAAVRDCGATSCEPRTRASLLRDLGTMQLVTDDEKTALASLAAALAINPNLQLNPRYDSPELRAAWKKAQGAAIDAVVASGEQPTGDFKHTPAAAQKPGAPLPIYVTYGGEGTPVRVAVRYRSAQATEWRWLPLRRMGDGWGGLLPCADVTPGVMRYWVQAFGQGDDPMGRTGDIKHPYTVPIKDAVTGEPPHLPGAPPPTCDGVDCPAGTEGCAKGEPAAAAAAAPADAPAASPPAAPGPAAGGGDWSPFHGRLWVGLTATLDFLSMPSGSDMCRLDSQGRPANPSAAYCTTPDGADFPSRASPAQSDALVPGKAGSLAGGLQAGNFRLMLAADYALMPWLLVGGRLGYTFGTYPGQWAAKDGRTMGSSLYVEARATYLFGAAPLTHPGLAPIAFVGTGLSEFDGSASGTVTSTGSSSGQAVNIWITDGPWFLAVGGGARYQLPVGAAFTGALRLNTVVGGNGAMVTYGPELGAAYAF